MDCRKRNSYKPGQPPDTSVNEVGVVITAKWHHVFRECYDIAAENRYNHKRHTPRSVGRI